MDDQGLSAYEGYVRQAGAEVREIIKILTAELSALKIEDPTAVRMFYPNGIERIYCEVAIGPKDKPVGLFSLEVAGAAGVKPKVGEVKVGPSGEAAPNT